MGAAPPQLGVLAVSPVAPPDLTPALSAAVRTDPAAPAWPRSAQAAAAVLLVVALSLLAWHAWAARAGGARPAVLESGSALAPVDLNRAERAELLQLPGVGPALAERIEAYRLEHDGFRDVAELRRVGGIGPVLLERLRPLVFVEPYLNEGDDGPAPQERMAPAVNKRKDVPGGRIDVNTATPDELQKLPRIGPKLAARIVEARKQRPFRSVDDLRRVSGIGAKTLDGLRPHITVGAVTPADVAHAQAGSKAP